LPLFVLLLLLLLLLSTSLDAVKVIVPPCAKILVHFCRLCYFFYAIAFEGFADIFFNFSVASCDVLKLVNVVIPFQDRTFSNLLSFPQLSDHFYS